jgi:hypothetical protein
MLFSFGTVASSVGRVGKVDEATPRVDAIEEGGYFFVVLGGFGGGRHGGCFSLTAASGNQDRPSVDEVKKWR